VEFYQSSKAGLLDEAARMLAVFHAAQKPEAEVVDLDTA